MSLSNGLYIIGSGLNDAASLATTLRVPAIYPPPRLPVEGIERTPGYNKTWRVASAGNPGSNLYTITNDYGSIANVDYNQVYVLPRGFGEATELSVEPAGNNLFRIHLPNKDLVLTLDRVGERVSFAPADGSPGQLWKFTRLDRA